MGIYKHGITPSSIAAEKGFDVSTSTSGIGYQVRCRGKVIKWFETDDEAHRYVQKILEDKASK